MLFPVRLRKWGSGIFQSETCIGYSTLFYRMAEEKGLFLMRELDPFEKGYLPFCYRSSVYVGICGIPLAITT
jgi:hypothetical protein